MTAADGFSGAIGNTPLIAGNTGIGLTLVGNARYGADLRVVEANRIQTTPTITTKRAAG